MDNSAISPFVPPAPLPFNDAVLARLASELARNIYPLRLVLQQHKVDPDFFRCHILKHSQFQRLYREAHSIWHSSEGVGDRISAKSAVLIEQWLEEANRLFHDKDQPMSGKNELFKILAKMAKVDGSGGEAGELDPGKRVVVNINLSAAGMPPVIIDKAHQAMPVNAQLVSST